MVVGKAVFCGLCCMSCIDPEEKDSADLAAQSNIVDPENTEALVKEEQSEGVYSPPPVRLFASETASIDLLGGSDTNKNGNSNGNGSVSGSGLAYGTFEDSRKEEKTSQPTKTGIDVDID